MRIGFSLCADVELLRWKETMTFIFVHKIGGSSGEITEPGENSPGSGTPDCQSVGERPSIEIG